MRWTSIVVLTTFGGTCIQPSVALAHGPLPREQKATIAESAEDQYSNMLHQLSDKVRTAKSKRHRGQEAAVEVAEIKSIAGRLSALDAQIDDGLRQVGNRLAALPAAIQARHTSAVALFKSRQGAFKDLINDLNGATSARLSASLDALDAFFSSLPNANAHRALDPRNLPFQAPSRKVRAPLTDRASLLNLVGQKRHKRTAITEKAAPEDFLGESEDVQLTSAIREQATSLKKDPVAIYNWVRNTVQYLPTYGSIQGSDTTLTTRRGNAFDIASLTIALLRASGIPARYSYGTVEMSADLVKNWVGCIEDTDTAISLMSQGGIPTAAVVVGGKVSKIRLEHVWVELLSDYIPSRGSKAGSGDTWTPIDPSFKGCQSTPGHNIQDLVAFDSQQYINEASAGVTINDAEGWIQGVNSIAAPAAMERYVDAIRIENPDLFSKPRSYFEGSRQIVERQSRLLPASLQWRTLTSIPLASLPESLRLSLELRLFESKSDESLDSPALTYRLPLTRLGLKRLSLTHIAATDADAAVIQQAQDSGASTLPAYLIQMRPQLKLDEDILVTHNALPMGQATYWAVSVAGQAQVGQAPAYRVTVGDEVVIGVDLAEVDEDMIALRKAMFPADSASENLMLVAMNFWMAHDVSDRLIAANQSIARSRLVSHGLFASPLKVDMMFGIPRTAGYANRTMDVAHVAPGVAGTTPEAEANFRRVAGRMGSAYEGLTFDMVFGRSIGTGISAVRLISDGLQDGARLYKVTSTNSQAALTFDLSEDVKSDISNATAAGKVVYVTDRQTLRQHYQGVGYVIEDPDNGSAAYLIDGGMNGGADDPCPSGTATAPVTGTAKMSIFQGILWVVAIAAAAVVVARMPAVLLGGAVIYAATASAGPAPFASNLPEYLQHIWDQVYGVRYGVFRSNALSTSGPRTCDDATYNQLRDQKEQSCDQKRSCANAKDCNEVSSNMQKNVECGEARLNVMFTCFAGGDRTHWNVLREDILRGIDRCACAAAGAGCT